MLNEVASVLVRSTRGEALKPSCGRIPVRLDKLKTNVLRPSHHDVAAYATASIISVVDHAFGNDIIDRVAVGAGDTITRLQVADTHVIHGVKAAGVARRSPEV